MVRWRGPRRGTSAMARLTDYTTYADAHRHFSSAALWSLFDGDRESLNIAHECVDRHAGSGRIAVRVAHADGRDEALSFLELADWSSRFAHWLGLPRGARGAPARLSHRPRPRAL